MLSYMIPVETKQTSPTMSTAAMVTTQNMNLALNLNNNDIIEKSTTISTSSMMDMASSERQISSEFITTTMMTTTTKISTIESAEKQHSVIECDLDEKINMVNGKLQHQTMTDTTTTPSVIAAAADKSKLTKLNLKNAPLKR